MFSLRVGQGFDLHRLESDLPLIVGGVPIEFPKGSVGHSDGDVLLHAIIDALLGAAGLPDIGHWFPPSDPKYANANSRILLAKTLAHIQEVHPQFQVINLDATLIGDKPNFKSYKPTIAHEIALMLHVHSSQVSIKAKTVEGLGPLGQEEALAAQVVVLVDLGEREI